MRCRVLAAVVAASSFAYGDAVPASSVGTVNPVKGAKADGRGSKSPSDPRTAVATGESVLREFPRRTQPRYTQQARQAQVQGTCLLEVAVDADGRTKDIKVISPLGFGLDEEAKEAVAGWEFTPGFVDGKPIGMVAHIGITFRLGGAPHDKKREQRRTAYNIALSELEKPALKVRAVEKLRDLAGKKHAPSMCVLGKLMRSGDGIEKDEVEAARLIRAAADQNWGPAIYEVGMEHYRKGTPEDNTEALRLFREASAIGTESAQFVLGSLYERGTIVEQDLEEARRYYRLCAASGNPICQYRLAELLFQLEQRSEREYLQALAWYAVAAERGNFAARGRIDTERPNLSATQVSWVERLKSQLVQPR